MSKIVSDIASMVWLKNSLEKEINSLAPVEIKNVSHTIQNLILCEKIFIEGEQARHWDVYKTCESFSGAFEFLEPGGKYPKGVSEALAKIRGSNNRTKIKEETLSASTSYDYIGKKSQHSEGTREGELARGGDSMVSRSMEYVDLARKLEVYVALHPLRASMLESLPEYNQVIPVSKVVIDELEKKIKDTQVYRQIGANIIVPAITEHVFSFSKINNISLNEAILEIRSSKHAQLFRNRCQEIDNLILQAMPRSAMLEMQKLIKELDILTERWKEDFNEEVKYVKRTISLKKLWGIGELLNSVGLGEILVKDPILFNKTPDLLFLNDFFRPPRLVNNTKQANQSLNPTA